MSIFDVENNILITKESLLDNGWKYLTYTTVASQDYNLFRKCITHRFKEYNLEFNFMLSVEMLNNPNNIYRIGCSITFDNFYTISPFNLRNYRNGYPFIKECNCIYMKDIDNYIMNAISGCVECMDQNFKIKYPNVW